jgi:hypothetical protein
MDVHTFKVYVTKTENFLTKLEPIKPSYDKPPETFIKTFELLFLLPSSMLCCYV